MVCAAAAAVEWKRRTRVGMGQAQQSTGPEGPHHIGIDTALFID